MANEIRHASSVSIATAFLGYRKLLHGDLEAAAPILERGLALSEEHDLVHGICANGVYLAWAALLSGDRGRGLEYLERGLERPVGTLLQWTRFGTVTAEAYLVAGRPDEARRVVAHGLKAAAERRARGYLAPLLRLEAAVLLAEGDAARARARAEEALTVAVDLAMRPEVGRCHASLATISSHAGDPAAAGPHLVSARRIFEELGMAFWAGQIEHG